LNLVVILSSFVKRFGLVGNETILFEIFFDQ